MGDLTPEQRETLARAIWTTSRADEGTISVTGANIVAAAVAPLVAEMLAAERERIAREIEARMGRDADYDDGMEAAARIARGQA